MVLDASLLNTQHYKVRIKSKVEQSREGVAPYYIGVVAIEKGAFGLPSTMVANFTYFTYFVDDAELVTHPCGSGLLLVSRTTFPTPEYSQFVVLLSEHLCKMFEGPPFMGSNDSRELSPRELMANVQDCDIIVISNSRGAITFTFGFVPIGNVWTPLSFQLWIK